MPPKTNAIEGLRRSRIDCPEFRFEKREDGSELPLLVGYAAKFDRVTDLRYFTESIRKGAFIESIQRPDDIRALFNHDPSMVLGRNKAGTLELSEDDVGLLVRIQTPDTQLGRDLVKSVERKDITQMSFGFYSEIEEYSEKDGERSHYTIVKAKLFDVSLVTFPAYEDTEIEVARALRSKNEATRSSASAKAEFEKRKRDLDLFNLFTSNNN